MEPEELQHMIRYYQQKLADTQLEVATLSARLASAQKQGAQEPTGE